MSEPTSTDTATAPRSAQSSPPSSSSQSLEDLCINAIRVLAMDAVQKADSGHPGTPMALAPLAYVALDAASALQPSRPAWLNRDRFVFSAGHASMLLYSVLYLTGYDLTLDDLKQFRQWESKTPGTSRATATRPESKRPPARLVRASATRWAWRSAEAQLGRAVQPAGARRSSITTRTSSPAMAT